MSMGIAFSLFPFLFGIVFLFVIGMFIAMAVKGVSQWSKNNQSPILTVEAAVAAKRMSVSHHHHHHNAVEPAIHTASSTSYFVTFQVESGDRMELHVPDREYGLLAEGDAGRLTFQGTRYLGFERAR